MFAQTLSLLDCGDEWAAALIGMFKLAGLVQPPTKAEARGRSEPQAGGGDRGDKQPTQEEVQALLKKACYNSDNAVFAGMHPEVSA